MRIIWLVLNISFCCSYQMLIEMFKAQRRHWVQSSLKGNMDMFLYLWPRLLKKLFNSQYTVMWWLSFWRKTYAHQKKSTKFSNCCHLTKSNCVLKWLWSYFTFRRTLLGLRKSVVFLFLLNKTAMHSKLCSYPQT